MKLTHHRDGRKEKNTETVPITKRGSFIDIGARKMAKEENRTKKSENKKCKRRHVLKNEHLIHLIQRKLSMACDSGRPHKTNALMDLSFDQSLIHFVCLVRTTYVYINHE